ARQRAQGVAVQVDHAFGKEELVTESGQGVGCVECEALLTGDGGHGVPKFLRFWSDAVQTSLRSIQSSGKTSCSALRANQVRPFEPPLPGLPPMVRLTAMRWRWRQRVTRSATSSSASANWSSSLSGRSS